eukprot:CAMPEP_0171496004 /NCGR_PEP_ID=MMETSP0958-20121227/6455_1 /TAXON_ID=87120 /ORGANISM="Aurantiochytrium limacinum, Strain ATCCMYA-1381" /LENGTH=451 /DNA_ID=CAMNT_0012030047 /DNA_START=82 /DNA_END=1437 /DNA_ORIENTATION=+
MASRLLSDELPDGLLPYKGRLSERFYEERRKVVAYVKEVIVPNQDKYYAQKHEMEKKYEDPLDCPEPPLMKELREEAKKRGVYNFFLPEVCGLTVLEYSPIAEILGAYPLANYAMNCSAPDTGNMEVLERYGSPEQKKKWLVPLLNGEIRSAFAMTEPGVASSDATNIASRIEADGDDYVINGHKWYISGACRPECKVFIFMGKTRFDGPLHQQQSMIIVPRDAPGVKILRPLAVFGHLHDHAEIIFDNVRVPKSNLLLGEGRGFEIAQGRLGPGRIHHCMRTIGVAEQCLEAMIYRAQNRVAFGKVLAKKDMVASAVGEARLSITMCRQLCYLAAVMADERGFKEARKYISMIKLAAPRAALQIIDEAIQIHGAHGISQVSKLTDIYANQRTLRVADGPDSVHLFQIARAELMSPPTEMGKQISGVNHYIKEYGKFDHVKNIAFPTESKI